MKVTHHILITLVAEGGGAAQSYVQNHAKGRSIKGGSGAGRGSIY